VIDREQVSHVARLARLELTDEEADSMVDELSGILEHVDKLAELELENVPPTDHVVELENVLRPDEPAPSLSREAALANAPDPDSDSFRVPSPQA
jgi:aspartyl-tRNA(Asn)/glutamyl-tRNA(Gln) amidotransferase subunit C